MASILTKGTRAPGFALHVTPDQTLSLDELAGRRVILAFYPADWSPVCGDQMSLYNHILPEFRRHWRGASRHLGRRRLVPSGVRARSQAAFALLADFEPTGAVARSYGAYRKMEGVAERALFVIDENGMIAWSYCSPIAVNPGADGILDALEALPPLENKDGAAKGSRNVA